MKFLIITAHPSSKGFTHTIAKQIKATLDTHKGESEILNLYDEKYSQKFLSFEDLYEIETTPTQKQLQEKITNAQHIIFIFPMWWGGMPGILKNFFDTNFSAGFAFEFTKGKPKGLLNDKKAYVINTCDAPSWLYRFILGNSIKKNITKDILKFCGIKTIAYHLFGNMRKRTDTEKNSILETVTSMALKMEENKGDSA